MSKRNPITSIKKFVKDYFGLNVKNTDLENLTKDDIDLFEELMGIGEHTLVFGIAGRTRHGKTTTINTLFDFDEPVGGEGTRKIQRYSRQLGEEGATLEILDFPGLLEDEASDKRLRKEYKKFFVECDVILWVIGARHNDLLPDKEFISTLDKKTKSKIVVGLSQVDIVEPMNWKKNRPSIAQFEEIEKKRVIVANRLNIDIDRVVDYCANYKEFYEEETDKIKKIDHRYNLLTLFNRLFEACDFKHKMLLEKSISELALEDTLQES
ncbi:MAG: hypothetical protein GC192_16985 [Bacteroidetes bacterium]|nr:hypothetical protein [Bacteroidota bacterium]